MRICLAETWRLSNHYDSQVVRPARVKCVCRDVAFNCFNIPTRLISDLEAVHQPGEVNLRFELLGVVLVLVLGG
jgi:hypothetical protein